MRIYVRPYIRRRGMFYAFGVLENESRPDRVASLALHAALAFRNRHE